MRKQSWPWLLRFSQWLACLSLITSLWGCATPYELLPSSSLPTAYLPTSAQFQAETERLALPPELRERLQKAVAEEACRARPDPRLVGQVVNDPRARAQMRLVKETLAWISEVAKDPEPSPQRLEHRQKLRLSIPGASTTEEPTTEAPTAEAEPSLLGEDGTEYTKGFVYGATSGAVPLAPQAIDIAIEVRALPKGKYWARFGRACGEIAIGTGQMILAGAGMGAGMGMCGSGGGAPAGYVVFAGSMALGANGYVTAWHGFEDLKQLRREGEPCNAPLTEKPLQQQAPTQQAAPAKPTETPAKPNSQSTTPAVSERGPPTPVETQTTTYDRTTGVTTSRTESGTTTVTRPRVKGRPSGSTATPPATARAPAIRNVHLAGKKHPKTGVPFDANGDPDFRAAGVVKVEVKIKMTGTRTDFTEANRAANLSSTPKGYTWHHHQDGTTMQLVPTDIHQATGHTGGVATLKVK